ncbi:TetR/AcrR family transcriptional regulator [Deinococcus planocerae]|uniref:TetR/AcrR family transcriptional regulator n=1 Tax=Deinococcus planocerae TaxID=1737569 RepID=UPI000C7E93E8|nr:TetR/AcrR family transcriptional regulator [Deinococcus planocerae]
MPRPRKEDARDTRELVLAAASALLHEYGYLGVSMDAVAERVGVRKASLYHHFPGGKEQVVLELAERAIGRDAAGFARAIRDHMTARARLTAIATYVFSGPVQTGRVVRDALRFLPQEHQTHVFDLFSRLNYLQIRQVIEDGVASGELRPHDSERSAWAFLDLVSEMGSGGETPRDASLATWIAALLIDGLGA